MHKAVVYHTISKPVLPLPANIDVSPERFEAHLKWLAARRRASVAPLSEQLTADPSKKLISITFDDGFQDNLTVALPLLEKYNFPAVVFVTPAFLNNPQYLTDDELKILAGHELITIGAHGLYHRHLTELSLGEARHELIISKQILEDTINKKVDFLAYPYGDCNRAVERLSEEAGYRAAWSVWNGKNTRFSLWRVPLGRNDDLLRFAAKISDAYFPVKKFLKPPYPEKQSPVRTRELISQT